VPCPYQEIADSPSAQSETTPLGVKRKVRTSAAMIGLALSMGATGLLLPRQDDGAAAAEPKVTDAAISAALSQDSVSQPQIQPSRTAQFPTVRLVEHVVQDGQTLQQLANQYQINVWSIALANGLSVGSALEVGQTLKIPVPNSVPVATQASANTLVAATDLSQLTAIGQDNRSEENHLENLQRADRNNALDRLRQQRDKLRDSLAELRDGESGVANTVQASSEVAVGEQSTESTIDSSSPQVSPSPVIATALAALPSLNPSSEQALTDSQAPAADVPAENPSELLATRSSQSQLEESAAQTYRVSPGDTVARIARAHNIPQSLLIDANRLSDPNVIFVGQVLTLPLAQPTNVQTPVTVASEELSPGVLPAVNSTQSNIAQSSEASVQTNRTTDLSNPIQPAVSPAVPTVATQQITTAQSAPELSIEGQVAVAPLGEEAVENVPTIPEGALDRGTVAPDLSSRFNPYVAGLLSEFRELRSRGQSASPTVAASADLTPIAAVNPATSATAAGNLAIAPHFGESLNRQTESTLPVGNAAPSVPSTVAQPTVVASAPLGSESYDPLLQPVTGRLVSPDLPPLPGADTFLPEDGLSDGYIWPARGMLTSGYGWRWGRMHQGIDIAADVGTPIYAAAKGVVEFAGWNSGGYGNMVEVRHADGSMTRYAHMNAIHVSVGQRVDQGEQLGEMGSTGYSTGPHLHFEVHVPSQGTVNPIAYLPAQ